MSVFARQGKVTKINMEEYFMSRFYCDCGLSWDAMAGIKKCDCGRDADTVFKNRVDKAYCRWCGSPNVSYPAGYDPSYIKIDCKSCGQTAYHSRR